MVTLLIGLGALLIAVIGCALLDPYPSSASEVVDDEHLIEAVARSRSRPVYPD